MGDFHISVNAHESDAAFCWSLSVGEKVPLTVPVRHSVSGRRRRRGRAGAWAWGGALVPSQSEKRLAKDLRRLRMVSAFTSSWLRLARGAGVSGMLKVLVRDWDLL